MYTTTCRNVINKQLLVKFTKMYMNDRSTPKAQALFSDTSSICEGPLIFPHQIFLLWGMSPGNWCLCLPHPYLMVRKYYCPIFILIHSSHWVLETVWIFDWKCPSLVTVNQIKSSIDITHSAHNKGLDVVLLLAIPEIPKNISFHRINRRYHFVKPSVLGVLAPHRHRSPW